MRCAHRQSRACVGQDGFVVATFATKELADAALASTVTWSSGTRAQLRTPCFHLPALTINIHQRTSHKESESNYPSTDGSPIACPSPARRADRPTGHTPAARAPAFLARRRANPPRKAAPVTAAPRIVAPPAPQVHVSVSVQGAAWAPQGPPRPAAQLPPGQQELVFQHTNVPFGPAAVPQLQQPPPFPPQPPRCGLPQQKQRPPRPLQQAHPRPPAAPPPDYLLPPARGPPQREQPPQQPPQQVSPRQPPAPPPDHLLPPWRRPRPTQAALSKAPLV